MSQGCNSPKRGHRGDSAHRRECPVHGDLIPAPAGPAGRSPASPAGKTLRVTSISRVTPGDHTDVHVETSAIGPDAFIDDTDWDGATLTRWVFNRRGASVGANVTLVDCVSHGDFHVAAESSMVGGEVKRSLVIAEDARVEDVIASQVRVDDRGKLSGLMLPDSNTGVMLTVASPDAQVENIPGGLVMVGGLPRDDRPGTGFVKIDAPGTVLVCRASTLASWDVRYDPSTTVVQQNPEDDLTESFWRSSACSRPKDGSEGVFVDARNSDAFAMALRLAGGDAQNVRDEDYEAALLMCPNPED